MGITTDRNDPGLKEIHESGELKGQQKSYLVLSDEERAKGFVRPLRMAYKHKKCGSITTMGRALSETYARDPDFYGGTFCCRCEHHFPLRIWNEKTREVEYAFEWVDDGEGVGS